MDRQQRLELAARLLGRWRDDPVSFARDVFGVEPWDRQAEILRAVAAHPRVAVRSGHKCGKTTAIALLAWWWFVTRPRARVVFTAASARQVRSVLWKEIVRLGRHAAKFAIVPPDSISESPESGVRLPDGREILGFSTDDPERMAGFSGPNMLFLVDEASGVAAAIFEAIEGNRAGGARVCMISNPTQTSGTFYEAFHSAASFWHGIHISSEEVALATERGAIPRGLGLADPSWVAEKLAEWGEGDPRYDVRVRGNFPAQGEDCMISLALVSAAMRRDELEAPASGPLEIGVDVARYGTDKSVIAARRGRRVFPLRVLAGFDVVEVAGAVVEVLEELRRGPESAVVRIDTATMGAGVADILRRQEEDLRIRIEDVFASSSSTAPGYSRLRDQCWGALRDFLREGGALPDDPALRADLVAPVYGFDAQGRIKVESKLELRKRIGRSTDLADAVALAVFRTESVDVDLLLAGGFGGGVSRW